MAAKGAGSRWDESQWGIFGAASGVVLLMAGCCAAAAAVYYCQGRRAVAWGGASPAHRPLSPKPAREGGRGPLSSQPHSSPSKGGGRGSFAMTNPLRKGRL
jgi:hypothetical protein